MPLLTHTVHIIKWLFKKHGNTEVAMTSTYSLTKHRYRHIPWEELELEHGDLMTGSQLKGGLTLP